MAVLYAVYFKVMVDKVHVLFESHVTAPEL